LRLDPRDGFEINEKISIISVFLDIALLAIPQKHPAQELAATGRRRMILVHRLPAGACAPLAGCGYITSPPPTHQVAAPVEAAARCRRSPRKVDLQVTVVDNSDHEQCQAHQVAVPDIVECEKLAATGRFRMILTTRSRDSAVS
jgi:hypothetical protein